MNLMKSLRGGLGSNPMQEQSESSSEPKPVYGGHSLLPAGKGSPLYLIGWNVSEQGKQTN